MMMMMIVITQISFYYTLYSPLLIKSQANIKSLLTFLPAAPASLSFYLVDYIHYTYGTLKKDTLHFSSVKSLIALLNCPSSEETSLELWMTQTLPLSPSNNPR
jgi:hypothetical protein